MAVRGLLDTNAMLHLLGGQLEQDLPEREYLISIIIEMELLMYPSPGIDEELRIREAFKGA